MELYKTLLFGLFAGLLAISSVSVPPTAASSTSSPQLVLFDHDGGVDDFITLLLLLANPQKVKLIGDLVLQGCHICQSLAMTTILDWMHPYGCGLVCAWSPELPSHL